MTHADFIEHKDDITEIFQQAIYKTLVAMGDDVKGITWFSSSAEDYNKPKS